MNQQLVFLAFLAFGPCGFAQNQAVVQKKTAFAIGESVELFSGILQEPRTLNIYLPFGYSPDSLRKYPVIYLLDGSANEDFIHIAGLVQFGSFSWIKMIPESIVVGIGNVDRERDFTYPTSIGQEKKDFPTTGNSARFIDFIEKELQPFIQREYRTDSVKTLIGQSLGGLLATEILFKQPDLFDQYIIVSPSLWWDGQSLLKFEPRAYGTKKSVYIGVGKEGPIMEGVAAELFQKLNQANRGNTRLFYHRFEQQDHGDVLHLAVYDSFEQIFRKAKRE